MAQYDKQILNALLDSYENSVHFTGENKTNRGISFFFNTKTIPAYFDESSLEYENVHAVVEHLTELGFVEPVWKKGKEGHILSKVLLDMAHLKQIYAYLNRVPKAYKVEQSIVFLKETIKAYKTPVCGKFMKWLLERIEQNQSVKEYLDIGNLEETGILLQGIHAVEQNKKACYIREFSNTVYGNSKIFEQISGKIIKVFREFGTDLSEKHETDIFSEYGIYHTPNYVYLKGDVYLYMKDQCFPLGIFKQGIGISGEDIENIFLENYSHIKSVMTIENLTTFFRWNEPDCLIVYLGGYHNGIRRILLKRIYECLPQVKYYHFGDIDAGGFEIYRDLKEKTEIPFQTYKMDLQTLKEYEKYGKHLTNSDRIRLEKMKSTMELSPLIDYMLEHNVKLEQECILPEFETKKYKGKQI